MYMARNQKIATIIMAVCLLTGFILMVVGNENGNDTLTYIGAALAFGLGIIYIIYMYVDSHQGEAFPFKKVFVCGLILLSGASLMGLWIGVMSSPTGWTPVGYEVLMPTLPLILSIIGCLWYWENH